MATVAMELLSSQCSRCVNQRSDAIRLIQRAANLRRRRPNAQPDVFAFKRFATGQFKTLSRSGFAAYRSTVSPHSIHFLRRKKNMDWFFVLVGSSLYQTIQSSSLSFIQLTLSMSSRFFDSVTLSLTAWCWKSARTESIVSSSSSSSSSLFK